MPALAYADLAASGLGPPELSAPGSPIEAPESTMPVLQLLTQGLNVHATRLDALARATARLERNVVQQTEMTEVARAEAERRANAAVARAEAAEAHAEAQLQASEARAAAKHEALERRLAELEARLDAVPPSLEELRARSTQLEIASGTHERELSARAVEIGEARQAHAQLCTRVEVCAQEQASALAASDAASHAVHAQLREDIAEANQRQRRHEAQTDALKEAVGEQQELLVEQQQAVRGLQLAATEAAAEAEATGVAVHQLGEEHKQLEKAQAQLTDTCQLGLARAVASAESMRDDSERISSALAELEGWSRRLERLEVDLSAAERRVDGAADEMRRQVSVHADEVR